MKLDINEIYTDEDLWLERKFRRDHYIMCGVLAVVIAIIILA